MLEIVDDGPVRTLALDRPDVRNALNKGLLQALRQALRDAERAGVRCLVVTGRGKSFSAGADIAEWADAEKSGNTEGYGWVEEAHGLVAEMAAFPVPTLALLNGAAVGAGLDMALACDFRFAADSAKFICAYTKMGYSPDAGGTWLMPRLIGLEPAKRFAFTGETWLAPEALRRGLVTEIHPADRLAAAGLAFAKQLASGPTVAQRHAKRLMESAATRTLAEQLAEERKAGEDCGRSEDAKEAIDAAVARREPVFKGR